MLVDIIDVQYAEMKKSNWDRITVIYVAWQLSGKKINN